MDIRLRTLCLSEIKEIALKKDGLRHSLWHVTAHEKLTIRNDVLSYRKCKEISIKTKLKNYTFFGSNV